VGRTQEQMDKISVSEALKKLETGESISDYSIDFESDEEKFITAVKIELLKV
jgi:hypothetical protein